MTENHQKFISGFNFCSKKELPVYNCKQQIYTPISIENLKTILKIFMSKTN